MKLAKVTSVAFADQSKVTKRARMVLPAGTPIRNLQVISLDDGNVTRFQADRGSGWYGYEVNGTLEIVED